MIRSLLIITLFLFQTILIHVISAQDPSPVIGILTQPRGEMTNTSNPTQYVIAASYVKWLESGGARSIPIPYDAPPSMIEDIFHQINGLLFPGGASAVPQSARCLLTLAQQALASNEYFPVWGTCLGFEYLVEILSNSSNAVLTDGFAAENISLPLESVQQRQLYADARIHRIVTNSAVTMNNHMKGVEPEVFRKDPNLNALFEITSTNHDQSGRPFVSTIEPKHPPTHFFYGVQFHPEKNAFEYGTYPNTNIPYEAINHSVEAVEFSNYLARYFVRLTKKQQQSGTTVRASHDYTKPNLYPLVNTYPIKGALGFEEYYVIPSAVEGWDDEGGRVS